MDKVAGIVFSIFLCFLFSSFILSFHSLSLLKLPKFLDENNFHSYFLKRIELDDSQSVRIRRVKCEIAQEACLLYFAFNVNALKFGIKCCTSRKPKR